MIDKVDLKQYQATRGGNIYVKRQIWRTWRSVYS